jgi:hypothetical protein
MTKHQERKSCIRSFMREHYTDERLVWLLAHARSGKLSYFSCCCFIGIPTADHANHALRTVFPPGSHLEGSWRLAGATDADFAFLDLANTDKGRRVALIPMILAEIKRRGLLKQEAAPVTLETALA